YNCMKIYFTSLVLLLFVTIGYGQKREQKQLHFVKAQFNEIVQVLNLNSSKASELEPVYMEFMEEIRPEKPRRMSPPEQATEEQIEEMTRAKLAMAIHIATVREKYYDLFRKILSPSQIEKMFQAEREIMRRVKHEFKLRKEDE
ncbi:MAG: hypothetical protein RR550_03940, partial [Rikenellaceae bacterium]